VFGPAAAAALYPAGTGALFFLGLT